MRYYLDTNTLIFILDKNRNNLHYDIKEILDDYANTLLVSSVSVQELLLLFRIGKFTSLSKNKNEEAILSAIEEFGIKTVFFNENHFKEYVKLQIADGHKDINDHLIISQAISDKIPLISSDTDFKDYVSQGLKFIYNKR